MKNLKKTEEKGYAILFTMVIVGVISMISMGLANVTYKQLILSAVSKDSQISFYQADMALECALYADQKFDHSTNLPSSPWICGISSNPNNNNLRYSLVKTQDPITQEYILSQTNSNASTDPCFKINIGASSNSYNTTIIAKGYNICDSSNLRTVEREIKVSY